MKEVKKYTQEEIKSNINTLTTQLNTKKLQRTELTQSINSTKKQIVYWEELDTSQIKMF